MNGDRRSAGRTAAPEPPPAGADPLDTGPPGPAEVRALIRVQLRTSLGAGAVVVAVVLGVPVLAALVPAIAGAHVWRLALAAQSLWILLAFHRLRRAERAERGLPRPVDGS